MVTYPLFFALPLFSILDMKIFHGKAELDAAGFIRAEENDKRIHIKKIRRKFYFFVKIRHIKYIKKQ